MMPGRKISLGERVVVYGWRERATVSRIVHYPDLGKTAIFLAWDGLGTSRVWAHDEGNVWFRFLDLN